jgi:hypothetical protein
LRIQLSITTKPYQFIMKTTAFSLLATILALGITLPNAYG